MRSESLLSTSADSTQASSGIAASVAERMARSSRPSPTKEQISEEEALVKLGGTAKAFPRSFRKRFSAQTDSQNQVVPAPRPARIDAVHRAIEECLVDVQPDMRQALAERGIPLIGGTEV